MKKPSVILMGSKPGAVTALQAMVSSGWDVKCVVITPQVQHPWFQGPSLEEAATSLDLPISEQKDLPDLEVDFVISYMYRNLVKRRVIEMASNAAVNFHAAPLPEFGGWAFYNVAILEGSNEYGCTCHHMDDGFDTGPLYKVRRFPINPTEHTAVSLERVAQLEMVKLFTEFMQQAETGVPLPKFDQDESRMRYLKKGEFDKLKEIPANSDWETIDRISRAFWYPPYDCAWTAVNGNRAEVIPAIAKSDIASFYQVGVVEEMKEVLDSIDELDR